MSRAARWDMVIRGRTVLTMEPGAPSVADGAIGVADGRIVAIGPWPELSGEADGVPVVDATDCLLIPGLVNTHSHLAMTLLRGLADDLPLKSWLEEHVWPAEAELMTRETVAAGTRLAAAELLLAGVTTTADMYFFDDVVGDTLAEVGMRAVVAESLLDFPTPRSKTPDEMIERQRELIDRFAGHPLITPAVAPHSPYTVGAANLVREAELAEEHDVQLHIHISETRWEVDKLLEEKGASPVAYLAELGVLGERTVAAHCVHVSPEDVEILVDLDVGVSHNPVSNLKLASGVAPVPLMVQREVKLGLGTDGAASNNTLDLLRDAQLTALLHKGVAADPTVLDAATVGELMTLGGARVLGLDDAIGTLTVGKEADIVALDLEAVHTVPLFDPASHLAYAARAADVRHVWVRGRQLVEDRRTATIDRDEVVATARRITDRLR